MEEFILKLHEEVFEETDLSVLNPKTVFKELDDWDSLNALSLIVMVDQEYSVTINGDDIKNCDSINQLFELITSRK